MKQVKRVYLTPTCLLLVFIAQATYGGFTSIPIRQDPRFISSYTPDAYKDQLIVETISDQETWVAWVNDNPNDPQRCEIRSYNWQNGTTQLVHEYVLGGVDGEAARWRLWERLPCSFAFILGPDGRQIPIYWEEDQLGIVDMKSCIALDLYGNPRVYVAVVVDIFAYTLEQHGHEPAAHISFIDVWDVAIADGDPVDCSGYVGALPGELGSLDMPLNYLEPELRGGLFIHHSPTGRPVECVAIAPAAGADNSGSPYYTPVRQFWSFWIVNRWDDPDPGLTTDQLYYKQHGRPWGVYPGDPFGPSGRVANHLDAAPDISTYNQETQLYDGVYLICEGSYSDFGTVSLIRCNPSADDFDVTQLDAGIDNIGESPQMAIAANMNWQQNLSTAYACWQRTQGALHTIQARRIFQQGVGGMTPIAQCSTYPYPEASYHGTNDGLIAYNGSIPNPMTGSGIIMARWQPNNAIDYVPVSNSTCQYPDFSLGAHHLRPVWRTQGNYGELYCVWMGMNGGLNRVFGKRSDQGSRKFYFNQDEAIPCPTAHGYEGDIGGTFYEGLDWWLARVRTRMEVTLNRDSILEFYSHEAIPDRAQVYRSRMWVYIDVNVRQFQYPIYGYLVKYPRNPYYTFESERYIAAEWNDAVGWEDVTSAEGYELTKIYNYFTKRPGGYDYFLLTFYTGDSHPWGNPDANHTYFRVNKSGNNPYIQVWYVQWSNN